MKTSGQERQELVRNGLVEPRPVLCSVCGRVLAPGERALCNDGYERVYGEFVIEGPPDHEDNFPAKHAACAAAEG